MLLVRIAFIVLCKMQLDGMRPVSQMIGLRRPFTTLMGGDFTCHLARTRYWQVPVYLWAKHEDTIQQEQQDVLLMHFRSSTGLDFGMPRLAQACKGGARIIARDVETCTLMIPIFQRS